MNKLEQALRLVHDNSTRHDWPDDIWNAIEEALAEQAEQEPVEKFLENNLVVENERVDKSGHRVLEIREEELLQIMELYAAPVRTKDLTDDELWKLKMLLGGGFDFARAVIAADREKNRG